MNLINCNRLILYTIRLDSFMHFYSNMYDFYCILRVIDANPYDTKYRTLPYGTMPYHLHALYGDFNEKKVKTWKKRDIPVKTQMIDIKIDVLVVVTEKT